MPTNVVSGVTLPMFCGKYGVRLVDTEDPTLVVWLGAVESGSGWDNLAWELAEQGTEWVPDGMATPIDIFAPTDYWMADSMEFFIPRDDSGAGQTFDGVAMRQVFEQIAQRRTVVHYSDPDGLTRYCQIHNYKWKKVESAHFAVMFKLHSKQGPPGGLAV